MMNNNKTKPKSNIVKAMINISLLMISIFPIFGEYGMLVQKTIVWATIFLGVVLYFTRSKIVLNKFSILYLFYIIFACFSILWSTKQGGAVTRILDMSMAFLFSIVVASSCNDKEDIYKYLDMYLLGVVIISVFCFVKDFSALKVWARLGKNEFFLAGQNQIYYSCILIYATMYSIYKLINSRSHKWLNSVVSIFLYLCGMLTAIRKCLIIPIIFLVIFVLIKNKKDIFRLLLYGVMGIVFLFMAYKVVINNFPSMSSRIDSLISDISKNSDSSVTGNSYTSRKWLMEKAFQTFLKRPIIGVGIGQFRYYAASGGLDLYAHNNFLEVLANTGIIGFIIYYSSYISVLIGQVKKKSKNKNETTYIIAFILAVLVMEFGQVEYYQLNFITMLSLLSMIAIEKKKMLYFRKGSE